MSRQRRQQLHLVPIGLAVDAAALAAWRELAEAILERGLDPRDIAAQVRTLPIMAQGEIRA